MTESGLDGRDVAQIEAHGLERSQLEAIVDKLRQPPRFVRLRCAANRAQGVVDLEDVDSLAERSTELPSLPGKFTPMSGAASRMFGFLDRFMSGRAKPEDEAKLEQFFAALDQRISGPRFAFEAALNQALVRTGGGLQARLEAGEQQAVVAALLEDDGLGFRSKPKSVIPFHLRRRRSVAPLEEHMDEALRYAGGRLHLTISPEHRSLYDAALSQIRSERSDLKAVRVEFSTQHPSTDSVAIDAESGALVRDAEGRVAFFPAGHGSLLRNLDQLDHPVVLRNVDNVPKSSAAQSTIASYHRAMATLLAEVKGVVGRLLEAIDGGTASEDLLEQGLRALRARRFNVMLDQQRFDAADAEQRCGLLRQALDRPIKIVGVVRNEGEPGGGPFVIDYQGLRVLSIVEKDEISAEQKGLMKDGAFFNPVDILIDPTDHRGQPFDLYRFVNHERHFVVRKPYAGRDVLRLEHPGLWNGAMEGWSSIFLALPLQTFAPVKEVIDLLRPQHQDD